jgi:pimeloyl-ACP methyl ester carboxylesterase
MWVLLHAVGSTRTAIIGFRETGPIAALYAAMHPELVSALILLNTTARYLEAEDHPTGESAEAVGAVVEFIRAA